jgi:CDP-2,3-bis-(O-geranylgeranyl)-sn-glycerol synthase
MDWILLLKSLYFFFPAYFANMTPTFATHFTKESGFLAFLGKPIDFGKEYRGSPILGSHKTWRGVILGTFVGILIAFFQRLLWGFDFFRGISFFNYREINIFFLGFLLSFGALLGDLVTSFFKRRQKIEPGSSWIPFDQISFIIGSFILVNPFFKIPIFSWLLILIFSFFLHIIVNRIGFWLKISPSKI